MKGFENQAGQTGANFSRRESAPNQPQTPEQRLVSLPNLIAGSEITMKKLSGDSNGGLAPVGDVGRGMLMTDVGIGKQVRLLSGMQSSAVVAMEAFGDKVMVTTVSGSVYELSASSEPPANNQEQSENWRTTLTQTSTPDQLFDWIGKNPLYKHGQKLDINLMQQVLAEAVMLAREGKPGVEAVLKQMPSNSVREQATAVLQKLQETQETSKQLVVEIGQKFPMGTELAIRKLSGSNSEIADGNISYGKLASTIDLQTPVRLDNGFRTSSIMGIRRSGENSYVMSTRSGSQYELTAKPQSQPETKQPVANEVMPVEPQSQSEPPAPAQSESPQSTPVAEPIVSQENIQTPPPAETEDLKREQKRLESFTQEIQRRLSLVPDGVARQDYEAIVRFVYQELKKEGMWEPNLNYDKNTVYDLVRKTTDKQASNYFNSVKNERAEAVDAPDVSKLVNYDVMDSLLRQVYESGMDSQSAGGREHFIRNMIKFSDELIAANNRFKQNGIDESSEAGSILKKIVDKRRSMNEGRGFRYTDEDGAEMLRWWHEGKDVIASGGNNVDSTKWADGQVAKVSRLAKHVTDWINTQQQLYQVEDQLRARQQNPENPQS